MPTNSSEGDIVYEKKNLRLKYVLEKNPENLSERSVVGKSIAGKEKKEDSIITRKSIVCARKVLQNIMESGTNFTRKNISERSTDRKSTRLNSSHTDSSRMPSSA